mgnify:CR=1 FL=1
MVDGVGAPAWCTEDKVNDLLIIKEGIKENNSKQGCKTGGIKNLKEEAGKAHTTRLQK